jgi:hypothetical protein
VHYHDASGFEGRAACVHVRNFNPLSFRVNKHGNTITMKGRLPGASANAAESL